MKFMVLSCLLVLACIAADNTPIMLCGRQLANARAVLCIAAGYNKRSMVPSPSILSELMEEKNLDVDMPWRERQTALSASWSRFKREGLADECCSKPCTTDVILNYC